ncbi:hypothetical protein M5689_005854 [Euphorbia peplus]|nr:hypothetical protein M5689_005854 [Euphorbia peplus]
MIDSFGARLRSSGANAMLPSLDEGFLSYFHLFNLEVPIAGSIICDATRIFFLTIIAFWPCGRICGFVNLQICLISIMLSVSISDSIRIIHFSAGMESQSSILRFIRINFCF